MLKKKLHLLIILLLTFLPFLVLSKNANAALWSKQKKTGGVYAAYGSFGDEPLELKKKEATGELDDSIAQALQIYSGGAVTEKTVDFDSINSNFVVLKISDSNKIVGKGEYGPLRWKTHYMVENNGAGGGGGSSGNATHTVVFEGYARGDKLIGKCTLGWISYNYETGAQTMDYTSDYKFDWTAERDGSLITGRIKDGAGSQTESRDWTFTATIGDMPSDWRSDLDVEISEEGGGFAAEDVPWKIQLQESTNAYVVIDGEEKPLTSGMILEPGMEIVTKGEEGAVQLETKSGEWIYLGGNSKVTLMEASQVEREAWREFMKEYGLEGEHLTMYKGEMVVRYESEGEAGWWNKRFTERKEVRGGVSGYNVLLARSMHKDRDEEGDYVWGYADEEDETPVSIAFENHSLVAYDYTKEGSVIVKVYEGEAIAYRLSGGEKEEVARIKAGESLEMDLVDYESGKADTGLVKANFDTSEKSEGVKSLQKQARVAGIKNWLLIGGSVVVVGLIAWLIIKKLSKKKRKR